MSGQKKLDVWNARNAKINQQQGGENHFEASFNFALFEN